MSGVTDTRFSGLGDRILTASMNDGTARVYSWGPRFSHLKHLVLKVRGGCVLGVWFFGLGFVLVLDFGFGFTLTYCPDDLLA